jgi:hypothetical protein
VTRDIKQFFSETAEAGSLSETLAKEAFVAAHPGERVMRTKICADETDRHVVVIYHGFVAAPKHTFYTVTKASREVTLLVDDSAYRPKDR